MTFDIREDLSHGGDLDEGAAEEYKSYLFNGFTESPEGKAIAEPGWSKMVLDYLIGYVGVTPADMALSDLQEVLLELFPRKVSCAPKDAPEIVEECLAFFRFLGREYDLASATACIKMLSDGATVTKLQAGLANPQNFGMAKGFMMQGQQLGFDMSTKRGIDEWTSAHNAGLVGPRPVVQALTSAVGRSAIEAKKRERQAEKAARKKNR